MKLKIIERRRSVRQCSSVRQCAEVRQCVAVSGSEAVCGSAHGCVWQCRCGSVWQCVRQCVAVRCTTYMYTQGRSQYILVCPYTGGGNEPYIPRILIPQTDQDELLIRIQVNSNESI
jgi:hypothetical protein